MALLAILLVLYLLITPGLALIQVATLRRRVAEFEDRLLAMERRRIATRVPVTEAVKKDQGEVEAVAKVAPETLVPSVPTPVGEPAGQPGPPPLPPPSLPVEPELAPVVAARGKEEREPLRVARTEPVAREQERPAAVEPGNWEGVNWEHFIGAKLFAWVGGVALFFGIVFFVKFAFERELISPSVRVATGYGAAAALMAAGYWFRMRNAYRVLTQTLSATGILSFYGVTYAAHAWYKFPFFTTPVTFLLMVLITMAAFVTAVRARAEVVAVLGLAGGYLTPALVSTGRDEPLILFGYVLLLGAGLMAVAVRQGWGRLVPLGAVGTVLLCWGWRLRFFEQSGYGTGWATWGMVLVFGGFALFFAGAAVWAGRRDGEALEPWWGALLAGGSAFGLAFDWLSKESVAERPWVLFTLVAAALGSCAVTVWRQPRLASAGLAGSLLVLLHLAWWMAIWLTEERLLWGLGLNLAFGLAHIGLLFGSMRRGDLVSGAAPVAVSLLMLVVMGVPLLVMDAVSRVFWPAFLLAALGAMAVCALAGVIWAALAAVGLTALALLRWLWMLPQRAEAVTEFVVVLLMATAVLAGGTRLIRLLGALNGPREAEETAVATDWTRLMALLQPFALLAMTPWLLPVGSPNALLGAALVLALVLQWMGGRESAAGPLGWCAWLAVAVSWNWTVPGATPPLVLHGWLTGVPVLAFVIWWFKDRRSTADQTLAMAAMGLLASGCMLLLLPDVLARFPVACRGLMPAAWALAFAAAASERWRLACADTSEKPWAAGLTLWFATLVLAWQFEGPVLTLAWSLEAAALCWLNGRLRHDGLRTAAVVLAALCGLRLLLELDGMPLPPSESLPAWLWLGIFYGVPAAAFLAAGRWLNHPEDLLGELSLRGLFFVLGGVLAFGLVNLEIAAWFGAAKGNYLTFSTGGDLAWDIAYTISWAVFAMGVLLAGFVFGVAGARRAASGLLLVTLAKLFLHDLARVDSVYRIAAFLAVAVVALGASFLYQRAARGTTEEENRG